MENILIVSGSQSAGSALSDFLRETFRCDVRTAETASQAKNIFDSNAPCDVALIYAPLPDENGIALAEYIIQNTASYCILIVRAENAEKLRDRYERMGIITIGRPFNKSSLYQIIKTVEIAMNRSYHLYQETVRLERKIDEIRTIDKAKFMLMQYRDMTESEAHAYIEKYAMDRRKKKILSASEIIDRITEQYL